jgi:hypothetical protein
MTVRRILNHETFWGKTSTLNGEVFMLKQTINALACALIAPLAYAQTSTPSKEQLTRDSGTVTTFEPGEIVIVGSESTDDTFCYVLDDTVRYVNKAGKRISEHQIKPGSRIHVYYDGTGEPSMVNRVVVDEMKRKTRKLKGARS